MAYGAREEDDQMLREHSIRTLREQFLTAPQRLQLEQMANVKAILRAELARRQNQPSYLMRHAHEIYGIDVRSLL